MSIVDVKATITAGKEFILWDSRGWDIVEGKVRVLEVIPAKDVDKEHLMNWMEIHTQGLYGNDEYEYRMEVLDEVRKMCMEPWVRYEYLTVYTEGEYKPVDQLGYIPNDPTYPIPGYLFADHIKALG